jgi:hypothetical protein
MLSSMANRAGSLYKKEECKFFKEDPTGPSLAQLSRTTFLSDEAIPYLRHSFVLRKKGISFDL